MSKNENLNIKEEDKERINLKGCHGVKGKKKWKEPYCVAKNEEPNREDQKNMTSSNEYLDEDEVLEEKMEIIADLIKNSKHVTTYTGAGLSIAAGIGDYASKSNSIMNKVKRVSFLEAKPTFAHEVLSKLEEEGLLHSYVQQNHDGLPQKAGFPQEKINEIHGSLYDPSNHVVLFGGKLRYDLFEWLREIEEKTDLCICLGTSLSGMNADSCALTPIRKYQKGIGNGTIMINLQQTKIDTECTIRVWARIDDAFKILVEKLGLNMNKKSSFPELKKDIFYIPYDEKGKYLGKETKKLMKLDFSIDSKIKIIHPKSSSKDIIGTIKFKNKDHYSIRIKECPDDNVEMLFAIGNWMIDMALRGACQQFSYSNSNPEFINIEDVNEDFYSFGKYKIKDEKIDNIIEELKEHEDLTQCGIL